MKRHHLFGACIFMLVFSFSSLRPWHACPSATAQDNATTGNEGQDSLPLATRPQTKFLRLQTDEFNNPLALQTATTKYVLKDDRGDVKLEVSLESVIHIADSSYYRSLQKRFERYDAVLFESLIKPKDPESDENELPSGFQLLRQLSTGTLGLSYEFEEVNYNGKNMRNADLTPDELADRMASLGQDKKTLLIDLLTHIAQKSVAERQEENAIVDVGEADITVSDTASDPIKFDFSILTDPDGIMKIRRIMASLLVDSQLLESPLPPGIHQVVIGDRNDRAMSILQEEFKSGKRQIAIFFGVGHMADFEKRLVEKHGMELAAVNWRNAWDLRDGAIEGAPLEGLIESTFRDSFKNKLRQLAKGMREKPTATKEAESVGADDGAEKDEKIKAMEDAIKALEAKLKVMEGKAKDDKGEKKTGGSKESGPDKKIDVGADSSIDRRHH